MLAFEPLEASLPPSLEASATLLLAFLANSFKPLSASALPPLKPSIRESKLLLSLSLDLSDFDDEPPANSLLSSPNKSLKASSDFLSLFLSFLLFFLSFLSLASLDLLFLLEELLSLLEPKFRSESSEWRLAS